MKAINTLHYIKHHSAFTINYVALVGEGWKKRLYTTEQHGEKMLLHVTTVDVLAFSHALSKSYSHWTECSSCIRACQPSAGHGPKMGLEQTELHLDTVGCLYVCYKQVFLMLPKKSLNGIKFCFPSCSCGYYYNLVDLYWQLYVWLTLSMWMLVFVLRRDFCVQIFLLLHWSDHCSCQPQYSALIVQKKMIPIS